jgi:2-hydroxymuconate-semialdehyde hydrolase
VRRVLGLALLALVLVVAFPLAVRLLGAGADASALPAPGRRVHVEGGLALNVVEQGAGEPVVLVHGLPGSAIDWNPLPALLAERGHRVIRYDRAGYGFSDRPPLDGDAHTYAANARQLGALLDALGIERAPLVGWSYGGGVVQWLGGEEPARASHLVLVGSVGPAFGQSDEADDWVERVARSPLGPPLFRTVFALPPLAQRLVEASLADAFSGAGHVPAGWAARMRAQLALPGTIDAWITEERRLDQTRPAPERVAAPTLVVHGSDDRVVPPRVGEDLARRIPGAELALVEGGSHMLPVTHAALLADRIDAWVRR